MTVGAHSATPDSRVRGALVFLAYVVGMWLITAFAIGAQPWVSLDTPDSEFHASMAIFGPEVTDRVPSAVYYWTRLGYILPAHALVEWFGPMTGLEIYRLALLAVIIAAVFSVIRRFISNSLPRNLLAAFLTMLIAANTVVLAYLGNPYPAAPVMAATFLLIALALRERGRVQWFIAGLVFGGLIMTNPYGTFIAAVAFLAVLGTRVHRGMRWQAPLLNTALLLLGTVIGFGALWWGGRALFPSLDWLDTYLSWNAAINQADYIYDYWRWTHDISLLVPAMAVLASLTAWLRWRTRVTRIALALSGSTVAFVLAYWWLVPTNYLEVPHYQALLWPASLTALALVGAQTFTVSDHQQHRKWWNAALAILGVIIVVAAGHSTLQLPYAIGALLTIAAVVIVHLLPHRLLTAMIAITVVFAVVQVLQNSRDTFGVSTQRLYANAYVPNETETMVRSAIEAETWLLERTAPGDNVLSWVEPNATTGEHNLLSLAAFHLWGANQAGGAAQPAERDVELWEQFGARALVLYGRSPESVWTYYAGIPDTLRRSKPECMQVAWPSTGAAHVCVVRLD